MRILKAIFYFNLLLVSNLTNFPYNVVLLNGCNNNLLQHDIKLHKMIERKLASKEGESTKKHSGTVREHDSYAEDEEDDDYTHPITDHDLTETHTFPGPSDETLEGAIGPGPDDETLEGAIGPGPGDETLEGAIGPGPGDETPEGVIGPGPSDETLEGAIGPGPSDETPEGAIGPCPGDETPEGAIGPGPGDETLEGAIGPGPGDETLEGAIGPGPGDETLEGDIEPFISHEGIEGISDETQLKDREYKLFILEKDVVNSLMETFWMYDDSSKRSALYKDLQMITSTIEIKSKTNDIILTSDELTNLRRRIQFYMELICRSASWIKRTTL